MAVADARPQTIEASFSRACVGAPESISVRPLVAAGKSPSHGNHVVVCCCRARDFCGYCGPSVEVQTVLQCSRGRGSAAYPRYTRWPRRRPRLQKNHSNTSSMDGGASSSATPLHSRSGPQLPFSPQQTRRLPMWLRADLAHASPAFADVTSVELANLYRFPPIV